MRLPRIHIGLLGCALVMSGMAQAQEQLHGYFFLGPTLNNGQVGMQTNVGILPPPPSSASTNPGSSNSFSTGAGAEMRFFRGWLGLGADLAGIAPGGGKVIDNTVGTFSPDLYVHVGKWPRWLHPSSDDWEGQKVDLYGAAGYTALFQTYGANAYNWAVGVNYWFQSRGFMVEFRRIVVAGSNPPVTGSPYSEFRFGFIFRGSSPH